MNRKLTAGRGWALPAVVIPACMAAGYFNSDALVLGSSPSLAGTLASVL